MKEENWFVKELKLEKIDIFYKSFLAGLMIGIAGLVSSNVTNPVMSAFIFAVGLVVIVVEKLYLFTGKIGYARSWSNFKECFKILLGNMLGVAIIALSTTNSIDVMSAKLAVHPLLLLFKGVWCGFLMYSAVDGYGKSKNLIPVIMCVMAFIIGKFNHCVADLFYIFAERSFTLETLWFIITVIVGNTLGAQLYRFMRD